MLCGCLNEITQPMAVCSQSRLFLPGSAKTVQQDKRSECPGLHSLLSRMIASAHTAEYTLRSWPHQCMHKMCVHRISFVNLHYDQVRRQYGIKMSTCRSRHTVTSARYEWQLPWDKVMAGKFSAIQLYFFVVNDENEEILPQWMLLSMYILLFIGSYWTIYSSRNTHSYYPVHDVCDGLWL